MAYLLRFAGGGGAFVDLASPISASGDGILTEIEFEYQGASNSVICGGTSFSDFWRINNDTSFRISIAGSATNVNINTPLVSGARYTLRLVRTGSSVVVEDENGTAITPATTFNASPFIIDKIGSFHNGSSNLVMDLYGFKANNGANVYDPSASGGTGLILPDTAGSNDGTLVNFPTDNSQWIFYDDGGGAVDQPVVSVNAEEVRQANTLSISAFNSVSLVIAEQIESANLIDVFLSQLASSIQAQETHDATALNIEQSASQSVNSIGGEQAEQASLVDITQSLPINSIQAQENQQANTLTIEQSAGQSITLNTAQQVEQSTVLSLAQQQALAHIVAEQLSAASVTDVSNLQVVTMIIAEESHLANTLNVEQYTGQLVTLITAEQKNEAQTLLISEVSAIDILQSEQVTNAETMAFSQVQRLTQITAEQLTEAQLLNILTSGDNTDLSGLRLIPVTSKYTINPTNTTRYSLQKV